MTPSGDQTASESMVNGAVSVALLDNNDDNNNNNTIPDGTNRWEVINALQLSKYMNKTLYIINTNKYQIANAATDDGT